MNLEKYIETIKNGMNEAYSKYENVRMDRDMQLESLDKRVDSLTKEQYSVERDRIQEDYTAALDQIRSDAGAVIDEQSSGYTNEVAAFYAPDGGKIDMNDMNLINSGLVLSLNDIWERILKYAENVTMLRIFQKYVAENKIRLEGDTGIRISSVFRRLDRSGEGEKEALSRFVQTAGAALPSLGIDSDTYHFVQVKLDEYELQAQIEILESQPVIGEDTAAKISDLSGQITELEESRGLKRKPGIEDHNAAQKPEYWGATM